MSTSTLFDYDVYDRTGEKIGTVENVWADHDNKPGYIGISTGWLGLGQTHVIPGCDAVIDHQARTVKVPYAEDTIKSSPSYSFSDDLSDGEESRLKLHYGIDSACCGTVASKNSTASVVAEHHTPERAVAGRKETVEVPLSEEKLHVSKKEVSLGEVRLRKVVRTEIVNQPVELRHEEVVVERVSGGTLKPGEEAFVEKVISIPLTEEQAVIEKTVQSAGTVKATKVAESKESTVSETLRKEDVEVEREALAQRR